jgi:oligoendopeptidase F
MKLLRLLAIGCCLVAILGSLALAQEGATQRSDIEDRYKWKLTDMYPTQADYDADFATVEASLPAFEAYKGRLGESPEVLLACLKLSDSINIINDDLYVYSHLQLDEDQRIDTNEELAGGAEALNSRLGTAASFIIPEILAIGGDKLQTFMNTTPELDVYRFYLEDLVRTEAHTLSPREEEILSLMSPVAGGARNIFNRLSNADISFGTIYDKDSVEIQLTRQRYYQILEQSDRRVRRDANREYVKTFEKYLNGMAASLATSFQTDWFYTQVRDYETCLDRRLDADNIPTDVFYNLIEAVNNNLAQLNKWTSIKKRILGLDTLFTYDQGAPLVDAPQKTYTFEEAIGIVLNGLEPMGEKFQADLEMGMNSGWIDAYENEGKRGGAYNWGTYRSHPYILLNFVGTVNNVFTLAHEMGHAMHAHYRHQVEPYAYEGATTFTAEVSSTAMEAILMKHLLETTTDRDEKLQLLIEYIKKIEGTFYTQVFFSEFEVAMHKRVEEGGAFSADYMRKTYRDLFQKYWGPDLTIDSLNDMGCVRISHFYRNYYVFQYATSYAAAQMLSQRILEGEPGAVDAMLSFLSTGSSSYAMDILKNAGVDMTTPEPIDATLKLFGELVDEVERLLDEK